MTIDDFEWFEEGFDTWHLVHKQREMSLAVIKNFNGWYIHALKIPTGVEQIAEHIDNLEAAKVIATIHVNQNMGRYPNANTYRTRAIPAASKEIPAGVFKMDRVRP
jgi:hypothetical protein